MEPHRTRYIFNCLSLVLMLCWTNTGLSANNYLGNSTSPTPVIASNFSTPASFFSQGIVRSLEPTTTIETALDNNYPCYADRRVWVPGQWVFRRGCKRWLPGRWVVERVPIPCPPPVRAFPAPAPYFPPQGQFPDNQQPNYPVPAQCQYPSLNEDAFQYTIQSIASRNYESSKLVMVRQVIETNCLNTQQVFQLMKQMSFESSRLELAKMAYGKTVDRNMYHLVNQAFESENSILELAEFIRSFR
jgi:hypothetical protein